MQLKKILTSVLSAVVLCATPVTQAAAAAAEPYSIVSPLYEIADGAWAELSFSGSSAICKSVAKSDNALKITAVQTLERQGFLWIWSTYGDPWTKTVYANSITMSNTRSVSGGKYRLKTVFTLTDSQGKTETITVYSSERSV